MSAMTHHSPRSAYGSATNTRTIIIKPSTIVFNHWVYLPLVIRQ